MSYDGIRALVIDDKNYSRSMTVRLLRGMGIRSVADAACGASGLEAYASHWPHVVICEPDMTPVDGFVFLQTLMAEKKSLGKVAPVIFVANEAKASVVAEARRLGAAGFMLRPLSTTILRRQIHGVLTQHGDIYGDNLAVALPPARIQPAVWRMGL